MSALDIYRRNIIRRWGVSNPQSVKILEGLFAKMLEDILGWLYKGHSIKKYIRNNFPAKFDDAYEHTMDTESNQYKALDSYICKRLKENHEIPDKTIRRMIDLFDFVFSQIDTKIGQSLKKLGPEFIRYFDSLCRKYRQ